jgi:hypothetical protein
MAKKIVIADDIDGTTDAQSYKFALGNDEYEIDLSEDNYKKLTDALAPFVEAGAKVTARLPRERSASTAPRSSSNKDELMKIRLWARENGYNVSGRGRVSQEVQDAYHAANR